MIQPIHEPRKNSIRTFPEFSLFRTHRLSKHMFRNRHERLLRLYYSNEVSVMATIAFIFTGSTFALIMVLKPVMQLNKK